MTAPRHETTVEAALPGVQRSLVVPEFFPEANALREFFDQRFVRNRNDDPRSFVWDYWHVPGQYTYHRTYGDRYFPKQLTSSFLDRLRSWGREVLGCGSVLSPWLSYYIDGGVQELHADVPQGPWAYVFSITDWEHRGFTGGETLLLRPESLDFWRGFDPSRALEAPDMAEHLPTQFNQLTIFDARIPHGVKMVQGTRDPLDSRIVLHGWFQNPEIQVSEGLGDERSLVALRLATLQLTRRLEQEGPVAGLLTVRAEFGDDGAVERVTVLSNTLVSTDGDAASPARVVAVAVDGLSSARVPEAGDGDWAILPFHLPPSS